MLLTKNLLLVFTITLFSLKSYSQDTIWISFPSAISQSTLGVVEYKENLAIMNLDYIPNSEEQSYSLFITDESGILIDSFTPLAIPDAQILSVDAFASLDKSLWLLSRIILSTGDTALISAIIAPETKQITVVDTIYTSFEIRLDSDFSSVHGKSGLENFGTMLSSNTNVVISNFYISITNTGLIGEFEIFNATDPYFILAFARLENTYFITFFDGTSAILDSTLSVSLRQENTYTFEYNDTTFIPLYTFYGCSFTDEKLLCIGTANLYYYPKMFVSALIDISKDSIVISSVNPLVPDGTVDDMVSAEFAVDHDGNHIAVAVGLINPFNQSVDPNALYITKYNPGTGVIWHRNFTNGFEIAAASIYIDRKNDIYLSGFYWEPGIFKTKGFVLKINENGDVISSSIDPQEIMDFTLFPNPAQDLLFVTMSCDKSTTYHLWTATGIRIGSYPLIGCNGQIQISHLPAGSYFVSTGGTVKPFVKL
jgi:hypothetical protein